MWHGRAAPGQSLVEYTLIVGLIVMLAALALALFSTQIDHVLSDIADTIHD